MQENHAKLSFFPQYFPEMTKMLLPGYEQCCLIGYSIPKGRYDWGWPRSEWVAMEKQEILMSIGSTYIYH